MRSGNGMTISGANSCLTFKTKKMMKKILFMVAAVAALAMVSCNKEGADDAPQVKEPSVVVEFSASISMGDENTAVQPQSSAATRTTVDHSVLTNPKTLWLETDEISINTVKFKVKELTNGGASAVFVNAENLPNDFAAPYKAVYPYAAEGKITLPATQKAIAGHFPENAVCAAAYSNDAVLKFKNVASVLMFQVAAECETVTISSDNALAGTVSMEPAGDDAVPTFGEGTEKTVTINGPFEVGKRYYVAVLPGKKENFTVCLDGKVSKSASEITIQRSGFADMKELPAPVVQAERNLKFSQTSVSATYGSKFDAPTLTGEAAGVVYSSSDATVATVDQQTGVVTLIAGGETVITATAEATETLKAGTASYTLKVAKAQRNLAFSQASVIAKKDGGKLDFTKPTLTGAGSEQVKYESSKTTVATVNSTTGDITCHAAGETTITASVDATPTHAAATATYKITVKVASSWRLVGRFGGKDKWDIANGSIAMYPTGDANTYVAENVELTANDYWKFNKDDKWNDWVGSYSSSNSDSEVYKTMQNHPQTNAYGTHYTYGNYKSNFGAAAGTYDIYLYVASNRYGDAKVWVNKKK